MKKVKVFHDSDSIKIQQEIDAWTQQEKPNIISTNTISTNTAACGGYGYRMYITITIVYTDNINNQ